MTEKQNQAETLSVFLMEEIKNKQTFLVHSLTLRLTNLFPPPRARLRIWSRSDKPAACGFLLLSLCSPQLLKPSGAGRHYQVGPEKNKKCFLSFSSVWKTPRLHGCNLRLETRRENPAARERRLKPPLIACSDVPVASDGISLKQAVIRIGTVELCRRGQPIQSSRLRRALMLWF